MRRCPACQGSIDDNARFCGSCGTEVGASTAAPLAVDHIDELIGRTLNGRYRVDRKIGEGGFGAVFEGVHLQMGRPVAVKVLHPRLTRDPQMAARFKREAQAACALRDPHTVTTHDFDQSAEGVLYIVLELIQGRSLQSEIERCGAIPPARTLALIDQVCSALVEAHEQEIVHRDIKPENILIEDRPSQPDFVKVVDFGIAKILHDPRGDSIAKLTAAGQIFGTLEYMSPEQVAGGDVDHRTDIYALGAMTYQMLTGKPPFSGTPSQLIIAHLHDQPSPPSAVRSDLSPELDRIVLRCMAKEPNQRYPDVQALRSELNALQRRLARGSAVGLDTTLPAPKQAPAVVPTPAAAPATPPPAAPPPAAPAPDVPKTATPAAAAPVTPPASAAAVPRPAVQRRPARPPGLPALAWVAIGLGVLAGAGMVGLLLLYLLTGYGQGAKAPAPTPADDSAPPKLQWSSAASLLRLVPADSELALVLRPKQLIALPGLRGLWARQLKPGAGEMLAKLRSEPEQLEHVVVAVPRLPPEGREDDEPKLLLAARGLDAAGVVSWYRSEKKAVAETHLGQTLHRAGDVALAALDARTLVGGHTEPVKQGLLAAHAGEMDRWLGAQPQQDALAVLRVRLPRAAQHRTRAALKLASNAELREIQARATYGAPTVTLEATLFTDSPATANTLGSWFDVAFRQAHRAPALAGALRRIKLEAHQEDERFSIVLSGPSEHVVALLEKMMAGGQPSRASAPGPARRY